MLCEYWYRASDKSIFGSRCVKRFFNRDDREAFSRWVVFNQVICRCSFIYYCLADSSPRPTKRSRPLVDNELEWVDTMPCIATNGHHRPNDRPRDDELGLMARYLGKMGKSLFTFSISFSKFYPTLGFEVKDRWPMFESIKSKARDWPGDTEKEGLGPHCVWKVEDGEILIFNSFILFSSGWHN